MIETAAISLFIIILSIIELCKLRTLIGDDDMNYKEVNSRSVMNASSMEGPDDMMDKKLRENMLKNIMA